MSIPACNRRSTPPVASATPPAPLAPSEVAWLDGYETGRRDAEREHQYQAGVVRMSLNAGGRS